MGNLISLNRSSSDQPSLSITMGANPSSSDDPEALGDTESTIGTNLSSSSDDAEAHTNNPEANEDSDTESSYYAAHESPSLSVEEREQVLATQPNTVHVMTVHLVRKDSPEVAQRCETTANLFAMQFGVSARSASTNSQQPGNGHSSPVESRPLIDSTHNQSSTSAETHEVGGTDGSTADSSPTIVGEEQCAVVQHAASSDEGIDEVDNTAASSTATVREEATGDANQVLPASSQGLDHTEEGYNAELQRASEDQVLEARSGSWGHQSGTSIGSSSPERSQYAMETENMAGVTNADHPSIVVDQSQQQMGMRKILRIANFPHNFAPSSMNFSIPLVLRGLALRRTAINAVDLSTPFSRLGMREPLPQIADDPNREPVPTEINSRSIEQPDTLQSNANQPTDDTINENNRRPIGPTSDSTPGNKRHKKSHKKKVPTGAILLNSRDIPIKKVVADGDGHCCVAESLYLCTEILRHREGLDITVKKDDFKKSIKFTHEGLWPKFPNNSTLSTLRGVGLAIKRERNMHGWRDALAIQEPGARIFHVGMDLENPFEAEIKNKIGTQIGSKIVTELGHCFSADFHFDEENLQNTGKRTRSGSKFCAELKCNVYDSTPGKRAMQVTQSDIESEAKAKEFFLKLMAPCKNPKLLGVYRIGKLDSPEMDGCYDYVTKKAKVQQKSKKNRKGKRYGAGSKRACACCNQIKVDTDGFTSSQWQKKNSRCRVCVDKADALCQNI